MIDRLTIERIKEAADIVDVVSEFVSLKRSGSNYKGLCPFHNECLQLVAPVIALPVVRVVTPWAS